MEKFVEALEKIRDLMEEFRQVHEAGMVKMQDGSMGMLESSQQKIGEIADEIYNIGDKIDTGDKMLDWFLVHMVCFTMNDTKRVNSPDVAEWHKYMRQGLSGNDYQWLKTTNLGMLLQLLSFDENTFHAVEQLLTRTSRIARLYPVVFAMTRSYLDQRASEARRNAKVSELEQQLEASHADVSTLRQEVAILRDRIKDVIPEPVVYDYEELRARIRPFKTDLLVLQRIFIRMIRKNLAIPVASAVAK